MNTTQEPDSEPLRVPLSDGLGALADDGWRRLTKPARVGSGTFGVGVSSRLVVEAAQRLHDYTQEEGPRTAEQAREAEQNRRKLWDMVNGPLGA